MRRPSLLLAAVGVQLALGLLRGAPLATSVVLPRVAADSLALPTDLDRQYTKIRSNDFTDWKGLLETVRTRRSLKSPVKVQSPSELVSAINDGLSVADIDVRGKTQVSFDDRFQHPVLAAIRMRLEGNSTAVQRRWPDNNKIALCIEGGGMSGCVAAGVAAALHQHGVHNVIDVVYGASAGGLIGAFFVSEDMKPEVYFEHLSRRKGRRSFIDRQSLVAFMGLGALQVHRNIYNYITGQRKKALFDLKFLLHEVISKLTPINWDLFWKKQTDRTQSLKLVCSGLISERAVVLSAEDGDFDDLKSFVKCMEAVMNVPGVSDDEFVTLKKCRKNSDTHNQQDGDSECCEAVDPSDSSIPDSSITTDSTSDDCEINGTETASVSEIGRWRRLVRRIRGPTSSAHLLSSLEGGVEGEKNSVSEPLLDALLFEPIPYRAAVRDNCTHILVVRTLPDGISVTGRLPVVQRLIIDRFFKTRFRHLHMWMRKQMNKLILAEDFLILNQVNEGRQPSSTNSAIDADKDNGEDGAYVFCLALPAGAEGVRKLETSRARLIDGVRQGYAAAHNALFRHEGVSDDEGMQLAKLIWPDELLRFPTINLEARRESSFRRRMRRALSAGDGSRAKHDIASVVSPRSESSVSERDVDGVVNDWEFQNNLSSNTNFISSDSPDVSRNDSGDSLRGNSSVFSTGARDERQCTKEGPVRPGKMTGRRKLIGRLISPKQLQRRQQEDPP